MFRVGLSNQAWVIGHSVFFEAGCCDLQCSGVFFLSVLPVLHTNIHMQTFTERKRHSTNPAGFCLLLGDREGREDSFKLGLAHGNLHRNCMIEAGLYTYGA